MTLLLSLDPAAERAVSDTGWALLQYDDNTPATLVDGGVVHGGFNGFRDARTETVRSDHLANADIVVCEHYVVFNRAGDPTPMLIEGIIRDTRPDTVLQPSSGYKTAVPDAALKNLGLWTTEGHHADMRSALRHAVWFLKKNLHRPTLLAGWPSSAPR